MNPGPGWRLFLAAAMSACLSCVAARAATQTTTFDVSANVVANCKIDSASPLSFGDYLGRQIDAKSDIKVTCNRGTHYDVGLDAGTSSGATVRNRKMTGPNGETLDYALYSNFARTRNWGNTVGVDTVEGDGNGRAQRLTVYGRVPRGQEPEAGGYADTITVTLTF